MKKIIIILGSLLITSTLFAQQQSYQQTDNNLQEAREGCQKPIGYFPTPAKLRCLLTAFGLPHDEAKPKALAMVFQVCHGRTLNPPPAGVTLKKYQNLASCLNDPTAIKTMNNELTTAGLSPVKVVNPAVLTSK